MVFLLTLPIVPADGNDAASDERFEPTCLTFLVTAEVSRTCPQEWEAGVTKPTASGVSQSFLRFQFLLFPSFLSLPQPPPRFFPN